ncbi:hypothetical protein [Laceyella putida]|uniref:Uncharacterized protein n=1 Tax=Laceyella putida TaxID=110101 RepID=A0ABW2RP28_9BACL
MHRVKPVVVVPNGIKVIYGRAGGRGIYEAIYDSNNRLLSFAYLEKEAEKNALEIKKELADRFITVGRQKKEVENSLRRYKLLKEELVRKDELVCYYGFENVKSVGFIVIYNECEQVKRVQVIPWTKLEDLERK